MTTDNTCAGVFQGGGTSCEPNECPQPEPGCAHDLCETGVALDPSCDPCVEVICDDCDVCAVDAFCCENEWDVFCVEEVGIFCGIVCD